MYPYMGLPVPANNYISYPIQPNPNNPAFNLQLSNDPFVNQYSAQVAFSVANALYNQTAGKSTPARVFAHNLYTNNNYGNPEFQDLCKLVMDCLRVGLMRNEIQDINHAINSLALDIVSKSIGANVVRFSDLAGMLPSTAMNECYAASNAIQNIRNNLMNVTNVHQQARMQGNVMGNNYTHNAQPNNVVHNAYNQTTNAFNQVSSLFSQAASNPLFNPNQHQARTPVAYSGGNGELSALERQLTEMTNNSVENVTNNVLSHQYSNTVEHYPTTQVEQPMNQSTNVTPTEKADVIQQVFENARKPFYRRDILNTVDDIQNIRLDKEDDGVYFHLNGTKYKVAEYLNYGEVTWTPSALQPHHPLVLLNQDMVFYIRLESGEVLAVVKDLEPGKGHMDYDKHAVNGNFVDIDDTPTKRIKERQSVEYNKLKPEEVKVCKLESVMTSSSKESAITESYILSKRFLDDQSKDHMFKSESLVFVPMALSSAQEVIEAKERINGYLNSPNLVAMADSLKHEPNNIIRTTINRLMTEKINSVLKFELSVDHNVIDDFILDINDLITVLKEHYKGAICESFNNNNSKLVRTTFTIGNTDDLDLDNYLGLDDDTDVSQITDKLLLLIQGVSVNTVRINSEELRPFFDTHAVAVLENRNPFLREVIHQSLDNKFISRQYHCYNYVVTSDGFKFEIAKSLVSDAYLIRAIE